MKITFVATTSYATPPATYGGEIYWWYLCKSFAELGHQVHLFAAPGSWCPPGGKLTYLKGQYGVAGNRAVEREVCEPKYLKQVFEGDYIIDASHQKMLAQDIRDYYRDAMPRTISVLNGLYTEAPIGNKWNIVVGSQKWKELSIAGQSQFKDTPWEQQYGAFITPLPEEAIVAVIPWATDCEFYCPHEYEKEDYFLFLARPTPYKGLHKALQLAIETGIRLKVVMPMEHLEHRHFGEQYLVQIEEAKERLANIDIVTLPGDSHHHEAKRELYRRAKALLVTVEAHEPFGLTLIEAMACGTPVVASNMGAFPEILTRKSGFTCSNDDEFKEAIAQIDKISPEDCRKRVLDKYDRIPVAKQFLELYTDLMMKYYGKIPEH